MQASSVPAEWGFSRSGLTVTKLRNRLHPETVRSLMCLQSWLKLDLDCEWLKNLLKPFVLLLFYFMGLNFIRINS